MRIWEIQRGMFASLVMAKETRATVRRFAGLPILLVGLASGHSGIAQISLASAVDLATRTNPRILMARDDIRKAAAILKESKDIYIPSVVANGGAGDSFGITLNVPTIFTVNAQSMVYGPAQRDYIRAASIELQAAGVRASDVRNQVEEDTTIAYLDVDYAQKKLAILLDESTLAAKLFGTLQHRAAAGIASELELLQGRRSLVEIQLERLQAEDQLALARARLGSLIGMPAAQLTIVPSSIPAPEAFDIADLPFDPAAASSPAVFDAEANAASSEQRAAGERRLGWLPQISFAAQYGRISPINGVTDFYNIHGQYNTFFGGLQFQFPLLDRVRSAHGEESKADAAHALHSVQSLRAGEAEDRLRLRHAVAELSAKAELAKIDVATAEDELQSARTQTEASAAGRPVFTPIDEDRAMLHQLQSRLTALDAEVDLRKAQISLLRQERKLSARLDLQQTGATPRQ